MEFTTAETVAAVVYVVFTIVIVFLFAFLMD